jgi:hypothetical protein
MSPLSATETAPVAGWGTSARYLLSRYQGQWKYFLEEPGEKRDFWVDYFFLGAAFFAGAFVAGFLAAAFFAAAIGKPPPTGKGYNSCYS